MGQEKTFSDLILNAGEAHPNYLRETNLQLVEGQRKNTEGSGKRAACTVISGKMPPAP
ncbi:MAG: hypothetical protein PHV51_02965 [Methanosarcinaceae archaeon]|nr:hypothetical protein [Methanosarcinaceae archaeon]